MFELNADTDKRSLVEIIESLIPGTEIPISQNGKCVAVIRKEPGQHFGCTAGSAEGKILYMASDFDASLNDFDDYMT